MSAQLGLSLATRGEGGNLDHHKLHEHPIPRVEGEGFKESENN